MPVPVVALLEVAPVVDSAPLLDAPPLEVDVAPVVVLMDAVASVDAIPPVLMPPEVAPPEVVPLVELLGVLEPPVTWPPIVAPDPVVVVLELSAPVEVLLSRVAAELPVSVGPLDGLYGLGALSLHADADSAKYKGSSRAGSPHVHEARLLFVISILGCARWSSLR